MGDDLVRGGGAAEPGWARAVRTSTRFVAGAVLAVGDHASAVVDGVVDRDAGAEGAAESRPRDGADGPDDGGQSVVPLVLGAIFAAEDRAVDLAVGIGRMTPAVGRVWHLAPFNPIRRRIDGVVEQLIARGAAEEALARATAGQAFDGTVQAVTASPVIDDVVNDVVARIIDPVLDLALPKALEELQTQPENLVPLVQSIVSEVLQPVLDEALPKVIQQMSEQPELLVPFVESLVNEIIDPVLQLALPKAIEYLNEDPAVVRDLVRDQSTGIAGELAATVRTRAVTADDRIEQVVSRFLRRRPAAIGAGGQPSLDALPPGPSVSDESRRSV